MVLVLLSLIEVSPIKINPWSRLAKIIGHALNAISIHALREEGDGLLYDYYTLADLFLSTPSARRAT